MRRRTVYTGLAVAVAAALVAATYAVAGGNQKFVKAETLTGYHETPSVSTTGSGSFTATIDDGEQTITYTLSYSGLEAPPGQAHIHLGQRAEAGGVSAFLCGGGDKPPCPPEGTVTGVIDAADVIGPTDQGIAAGEIDELIAAIRAGYTYANVHTSKFPGGEIRGQINDQNQRED